MRNIVVDEAAEIEQAVLAVASDIGDIAGGQSVEQAVEHSTNAAAF
jgi:hypothetical protein